VRLQGSGVEKVSRLDNVDRASLVGKGSVGQVLF
jgi:hypothetical protein